MTVERSPVIRQQRLNLVRDDTFRSESVLNVQRFRAVGDGVVDDTPYIQACITKAIEQGKAVYFPPPRNFYRVTGTITGDGPCRIFSDGMDQCEVVMETSATEMFEWTGNGLRIDNIKLTGPSFATLVTNSTCVKAYGADSDNYISGVHLYRVHMTNWAENAAQFTFVDGFSMKGCLVNDIAYAGLITYSASHGQVDHNEIHDIDSNSANSYGVALTRVADTDLDTYPRSSHIRVNDNLVYDIPNWEALDTHGGSDIQFLGNIIYNVLIGIQVGDNGVAADTAPKNITVHCNQMDSSLSDGTARQGIIFHGVLSGTPGSPTGYATGSVTDNLVIGFGLSDSSGGNGEGGFYSYATDGLVVSGNSFRRCSPAGVVLDQENRGISTCDNNIEDPWSDTNNKGYGVYSIGAYNDGLISCNHIHRGDLATPSPGAVLEYGVIVSSATGTDLVIGPNRIKGASGSDYSIANSPAGVIKVGSTLRNYQGRIRNYRQVDNSNANLDETYDFIAVSTTTTAVTLTLPATHTAGLSFEVLDRGSTASSNNITLGRNGNLINGAAADYVISTDADQVKVISNGTGWFVNRMPR